MKTVYHLIILFIVCILIACQEKVDRSKEQYESKHINFISSEDVPEPPPPDYRAKFQTLEEWLSNICDN